MKMYAKGEEIKGTGHYDSNNHWVYDSNGTTSVLQHCIDVGVTTRCLLDRVYFKSIVQYVSKNLNLSEKSVIQLFSLLSALHDVGKVHPFFQKNFENAKVELLDENLISKMQVNDKGLKIRHEVVSREIIKEYLQSNNYLNSDLYHLLMGFLYAISSHHEKDKNKAMRDTNVLKGKDCWHIYQKEIVTNLLKYFSFNWNELKDCNIQNVDKVCTTFFIVLILSDWVASSYLSEKYLEFDDLEKQDKINEYIIRASEEVEKVLKNQLGLIRENKIDLSSYEKIFGKKDFILRPVQKVLEDVLNKNEFKMLIIEAPMGEGKTEAGLYAAGKMGKDKDGIAFAFPTTVTSNTGYERLKNIFFNNGIFDLNLLHSTSFVHEKLYTETVEDVKNFLGSSKTGLFVHNCVCTVDQLMMGVLQARFACLRLLGLINKVLIIDEVHAYDAYMQGILDILLSWCNALDIPVIMLSATLPKKVKERYIQSYSNQVYTVKENNYPLITGITKNDEILEIPVEGTYMKKNINFEFITVEKGYETLCDKMKKHIDQSENISIICNTVKECVEVYKYVSTYFNKNECLLLHSKFTVEDRVEKEKYILKKLGPNISKRSKGLIVVGTQVLEQSLDIDFDTTFTMPCPVDLLFQRLGRNRRFNIEGRKSDCTVYIVNNLNKPGYEQYHFVYEPYILKKTEEYLKENPTCALPEDFRKALSFVYDTLELEDTDFIEMYSNNEVKRSLGKIKCISKDMGCQFQRELSFGSLEDIDDDIEDISTRLGRKQKKIIFLLFDEVETYGVENLRVVKDKELAIKLINKSFIAPYDNLPIEKEENYIECKGFLKGYRIFVVKQFSDDIIGMERKDMEDKNNQSSLYYRQLYYSKKYGYLYNQEKI